MKALQVRTQMVFRFAVAKTLVDDQMGKNGYTDLSEKKFYRRSGHFSYLYTPLAANFRSK